MTFLFFVFSNGWMWADGSFQGLQICLFPQDILNMDSKDHGFLFNRSLKCWGSETESVLVMQM